MLLQLGPNFSIILPRDAAGAEAARTMVGMPKDMCANLAQFAGLPPVVGEKDLKKVIELDEESQTLSTIRFSVGSAGTELRREDTNDGIRYAWSEFPHGSTLQAGIRVLQRYLDIITDPSVYKQAEA